MLLTRPYFDLDDLVQLCNAALQFQKLLKDHAEKFEIARGSSHNHQAWDGGYLDHVVETLNIAFWLVTTSPRPLPFSLSDALEVMFLHDLEKPWKHTKYHNETLSLTSKSERRAFRDMLIQQYGIQLSDEQRNALRYVEGVPDSEYTPGKRTMGELAALCHCCDILSARLWHDKGAEGAW